MRIVFYVALTCFCALLAVYRELTP